MSSPLFVRFWGTRGHFPTPGPATRIYGGNTPCVEVRTGAAVFICDAGTGIRSLGRDLLRREPPPNEIHLFLSRLAWDHVEGLPSFAPAFAERPQVRLHGSAQDNDRLLRLLAGEGGIEFAADGAGRPWRFLFENCDSAARELAGVAVGSLPLNHPRGSRGFSFEHEGRKVVYATDHELTIQTGDKFPDPKNESLLMRKMPQEMLRFAQGADLLIMDAQYTEAGYATHIGAGHSNCISVTDFALQAQVKQLALFHHDPDDSDFDLEDKVKLCLQRTDKFGAQLPIFAAREGITLKF